MGAVALGACAGPEPDEPEAVGCEPAPGPLLEAIQERVTEEGVLRYGAVLARATPEGVFISAELHPPDDDEDAEGDIYTWTAASLETPEFFSVDQRARDDSSWPAADVDMRDVAAVKSRGCTARYRSDG